MGIKVSENAPDADELMMQETTTDEDAAEAAAAALATVEKEIGRTTDPVRMYMREMGTVELLTREVEIAIGCCFKHLDTHVVNHLNDIFNLIGIRNIFG